MTLTVTAPVSSEMFQHIPVLLNEAVAALAPKATGLYVDATFGRGGYSKKLLEQENCRVIAIDRDPQAIAVGKDFERAYGARFTMMPGTFGCLDTLLQEQDIDKVDGIVFDIGVSSPQLDDATRGFSFRLDGPLDMRMGDTGPTAADLVNTLSEKELADTIYAYGEERASRRIARAIVEKRQTQKFTRTKELADIVAGVVRRRDDTHPATQTFQALRIAVNDELGELQRGLSAAEQMLAPGGRLAVVTFHSLEDRCVKTYFNTNSGNARSVSRHRPLAESPQAPRLHVVTRKPITAKPEELASNPRARSAKLRVAEKPAEK